MCNILMCNIIMCNIIMCEVLAAVFAAGLDDGAERVVVVYLRHTQAHLQYQMLPATHTGPPPISDYLRHTQAHLQYQITCDTHRPISNIRCYLRHTQAHLQYQMLPATHTGPSPIPDDFLLHPRNLTALCVWKNHPSTTKMGQDRLQ